MTHADAKILTSYLDHHFPHTPTCVRPDRLPRHPLPPRCHLGTAHAARFTHPDRLRDQWSTSAPADPRRWIDERCDFVNDWTPPVILQFSIALSRSWSTPVTSRNGRRATENERGNGQHRRTPTLPAHVVPDSLSDAKRNEAVTAGVRRRVSCRPVIFG
ncbi:DUF6000 family protein [Streptomyces hirsutus]|uniref:DUF6000 family protein n=1 Tax=Streptomyces hirsutus TaxID=35620 RepID=UPI003659D07C